MNSVFIVTKRYPTYDLVNDDLGVMFNVDPCEVCAVFSSHEDAEDFVKDMSELMQQAVENNDCDPVEYRVQEWVVDEKGVYLPF